MTTAAEDLRKKAEAARAASKKMAYVSTAVKNAAINAIADGAVARRKEILAANKKDYDTGVANGMGDALLDRLRRKPIEEGRRCRPVLVRL